MIGLKPPSGPYTIEMVEGVTFTVTPLTTLDYSVAHMAARRRLEEIEKSLADVEAAGFLPANSLDLGNPDEREGLYREFLVMEMAVRHITGWQGVVDNEMDEPVPVTPEKYPRRCKSNSRLARFSFKNSACTRHFCAKQKPVSGKFANGILRQAAGRNIAKAASMKIRPAPRAEKVKTARAARIANLPRRLSKNNRHGKLLRLAPGSCALRPPAK